MWIPALLWGLELAQESKLAALATGKGPLSSIAINWEIVTFYFGDSSFMSWLEAFQTKYPATKIAAKILVLYLLLTVKSHTMDQIWEDISLENCVI